MSGEGGGSRDTSDIGANAGAPRPESQADGAGEPTNADPEDRGAREAREQETRAIEVFKRNDVFQSEAWERLDRAGRLAALQTAENEIAGIQGRDPLPVRVQEGIGEGDYGGYNGREILIGEHSIDNDPANEVVNTLAHEGRHAYQDYAMEHLGVHHDPAEVEAWRDNIYVTGYIDPELDPVGYRNQPVEADAWAYGDRIEGGVYGGAR